MRHSKPIAGSALSEELPAAGVHSAADRHSLAVPLVASVGQSPAGPLQAVPQQPQSLLELSPERPAGLRSLPHTAVA